MTPSYFRQANRNDAIAALMASLVIAVVVFGFQDTERPPAAATRPQSAPPTITTPVVPCTPEAYPEWTEIDYRAPGKTSPVSLVPEVPIRGWDDFNHWFHPVMCGGEIGQEVRGPNRLVAEGVVMALNGGQRPNWSESQWRAVVGQVMRGWIRAKTRLSCVIDEPRKTKTVYGYEKRGKLVLGADTIDGRRKSCYAYPTFRWKGRMQTVKINLACMQVTTNEDGKWSRPLRP